MKNRNIIYAPDTQAATIFDKHTSGLSELVGESYLADAPGEVIAFPGKPLTENISKGDIIINRALDEGNLAFRHIVVNNKIQEGRNGGEKYIRVESINEQPQWVKIASREGIVKPNILIFKSKLSEDVAAETKILRVDSFTNDIEFDELYDDELQEIMDFQPSEAITPLPVPTSRPVPFASPPPFGSYWPLVSNHRRSKEVAFQYSTSGTYHQKFIGNASRRFLASRKKGARYHVGIDLYASYRDKVVACEDGKIINFYHFYHGAYALIVEHENIVINYGEVDRNSLRANGLRIGSQVKAGQVIGMVGKMESSSMLHFETYRKGTRTNLRWYKSKQAPSLLLNPTKYLLYLKTHGKIATPSGGGGTVIPPVGPTVDINSATDYNGRKSVELGWINRLSGINRYFNLPLDSPANSAALVRAVYPYQIRKGMTGRDVDGKLGPGTWALLQNDIQSSAPPVGPTVDINSATDYNGRKSVELGWINRLSDINRYFNLPLDSPANSAALVRAVYPYQIRKGMTGRDVDGKLGPGTWTLLQNDIQNTAPPVGPNVDINSATDYNGRKSVELGWINRLSDINRYFNLPLDSPANSAALVRAVYPYQIRKGMTGSNVDGKIGPNTWRLLQGDIGGEAPVPTPPTPTPTSGLAANMARIAINEWNDWGRGTTREDDPTMFNKLKQYYLATRQVDTSNVDRVARAGATGRSAWSAAFISYVVKTAGGGNHFVYTWQHWQYIVQAKQNRTANRTNNPFWLYSSTDTKPEVGDIICNWRGSRQLTYDNVQDAAPHPSTERSTHCDIVTEIDLATSNLYKIGGNKSDSVNRQRIRLNAQGYIENTNRYFAIIKVRRIQSPLSPPTPTPGTDTERFFKDQQRFINARLTPNTALNTSGQSFTTRQVTRIYNRVGNLMNFCANVLGINHRVAYAVFLKESGGNSFVNGNPLLRFENHVFWNRWGQHNSTLYRTHFKHCGNGLDEETCSSCERNSRGNYKRWRCHRHRLTASGSWIVTHPGGNQQQARNWEALNLALRISSNNDAAYLSASYGGSQVVGFNYGTIGYDTVAEMVDAFRASERWHVLAFFDYLRNRDGALDTLTGASIDWEEFGRLYNGQRSYGRRVRELFNTHTSHLPNTFDRP